MNIKGFTERQENSQENENHIKEEVKQGLKGR